QFVDSAAVLTILHAVGALIGWLTRAFWASLEEDLLGLRVKGENFDRPDRLEVQRLSEAPGRKATTLHAPMGQPQRYSKEIGPPGAVWGRVWDNFSKQFVRHAKCGGKVALASLCLSSDGNIPFIFNASCRKNMADLSVRIVRCSAEDRLCDGFADYRTHGEYQRSSAGEAIVGLIETVHEAL